MGKFVTNPDVVGVCVGSIGGCCRSIHAHRLKHGQLERLREIYEELLSLTEEIQCNGERELSELEKK